MENTVENNFNTYSLLIQINTDGFSILVSDKNRVISSKKELHLDILNLSEKEILANLSNVDELKLTYRDVQIFFETDKYTIIPKKLFQVDNAKDFLNFQFQESNKKETVLYHDLRYNDTIIVFYILSSVKNTIKSMFPELEIKHHLGIIFTDFVISQKQPTIHVWRRKKTIDIVATQNSNLLLINSFNVNTNEDVVYYILKIFEQLNLDVEDCKVILCNMNTETALRNLLRKYIKTCDIAIER